ncbi:hypothetical protein BGX26_005417, partial [Mortierella sp. AD094]
MRAQLHTNGKCSSSKPEVPPQVLRAVYKDDVSGVITPTSDIINIQPRFNSESGEYIILWNDIKSVFENSLHIRHGDTAILFLTDEKFEFLIPHRISAYPGVVLDVVIETPGVGASAESQRIQHSKTSTSASSTPASNHSRSDVGLSTTSGSSSAAARDNTLTHRTKRAPLDLSGVPESTATAASESISRASQTTSDFNDDSRNRHHHNQPANERNNSSVDGLDDQDMDKNYIIGLAYHDRKDAGLDFVKALHYFLKAANQGHASAQYRLWKMKTSSQLIKDNHSKFIDGYQKAADQGHADAQSYLGFMFEAGCGLAQDLRKAVELYQRAVDQGHVFAQCSLGFMYENGYGIPKDHFKAVELYQKAADRGCANAQSNLGEMYEDGYGVTVDYIKARAWYRKAADQGYANAQSNLGATYQNGFGIKRDYTKAIEWYQKAADQGCACAQSNLGFMHQKGFGVPRDYSKA